MSDILVDLLWVEPKTNPPSPEDRVEEALRKALASTTPERPGVPWDEQPKRREGSYIVPGAGRED
jgi:hypothetical protein